MKKNIPILTFVSRHWLLIVLAIGGITAILNESLFVRFGSLLFIPGVVFLAALVAYFLIHLRFRGTIDKDIHSGRYLADWEALTSAQRQYVTMGYVVGVMIFVALIAASVGK